MEHSAASSPLLSIVIPTRNRVPYAISAIQSVLEIPHPRLELVVQDNSDNRELDAWICANVSDPRLRYRYTATPLSFIHNFDAAARLTTGEYVCFIGDDDGVNPEIMDAACWSKSEDLDALVVRQPATYVWPGAGIPSTIFVKITDGVMRIRTLNGNVRVCPQWRPKLSQPQPRQAVSRPCQPPLSPLRL
jgi:glycosyltransferase involved in cell wall biosynthesis